MVDYIQSAQRAVCVLFDPVFQTILMEYVFAGQPHYDLTCSVIWKINSGVAGWEPGARRSPLITGFLGWLCAKLCLLLFDAPAPGGGAGARRGEDGMGWEASRAKVLHRRCLFRAVECYHLISVWMSSIFEERNVAGEPQRERAHSGLSQSCSWFVWQIRRDRQEMQDRVNGASAGQVGGRKASVRE